VNQRSCTADYKLLLLIITVSITINVVAKTRLLNSGSVENSSADTYSSEYKSELNKAFADRHG